MANMTSVVLIRGRGMRLGIVNGWVRIDESSRGWPKPGVSSKRRTRQNAQKKYAKILQQTQWLHLGDGAAEVQV
jgi:hypothetical protein